MVCPSCENTNCGVEHIVPFDIKCLECGYIDGQEAWHEKQIELRDVIIDDGSKYRKSIKGVDIDIYDVLHGFNVVNPAIQHAVKKLLASGQRGHKSKFEDLTEAEWSIGRAIELEGFTKTKENK